MPSLYVSRALLCLCYAQQMNMPSIQNDLSYFRRTMSRRGKNMPPGIDFELGNCISTEIANEMSLFYADHTPMLKALGEGAIRFVEEVRALFCVLACARARTCASELCFQVITVVTAWAVANLVRFLWQ